MKMLFTTILLCISMQGIAQSILAFADDGFLYEINLENCGIRQISEHFQNYGDIAAHPNGNLYGVDGDELYKLDTINSIDELVFTFPEGANGLTCSKEGLFYASRINGQLRSYDLVTGEMIFIGEMISTSSGDLTFYNEDLYCAGKINYNGKIVRVNLDVLAGSEVVIHNIPFDNSSLGVYGLTTVVSNCDEVNVYAAQALPNDNSRIYKVNFNANSMQLICDVGIGILGTTAFNEYHNSSTLLEEITIDSFVLTHPTCNTENGALEIMASGNGPLLYSINNEESTENSNFENLEEQLLSLFVYC